MTFEQFCRDIKLQDDGKMYLITHPTMQGQRWEVPKKHYDNAEFAHNVIQTVYQAFIRTIE